MKKSLATVLSLFSLLIAPVSASAAVNSINGQNGAAQTLATTSAATTTMHMKIVSSGNTHTFKWDNSPWNVNQGGTGTTSIMAGALIFGNGINPLSADSRLTWDGSDFFVLGSVPNQGFRVQTDGSTIYFGNGSDFTTSYIAENGGIYLAGPDPTRVAQIASDGLTSEAYLDVHLVQGSAKTFTFPNNSGTFGLLEANQTWTGNNTFSKGTGTTTVSFGSIGESTSHVCFNTKNTDGDDISFFFVGTSMVVEANACQ